MTIEIAQILGLILGFTKIIKIGNLFINLPIPLGEHKPKSKPGRPGCKLDTKADNLENNDDVEKPEKKKYQCDYSKNLANEGRL